MAALAERTKIKAAVPNIPSTTSLFVSSISYVPYRWLPDLAIDANVYMIALGSTKIQQQNYIQDLSIKAKEILHRIYQFKNLKPNWDGNGGLIPGDNVIEKAANFLTKADEFDLPIYFTAPGPNGEIVLEYKSNNSSAEIFFDGSDNNSEMLLYKGNDQVYAGDISFDEFLNHLNPNT